MTSPETDPAATDVPEDLGDRGATLYARLGFERDTAEGVLAHEAARVADAIDRLHEWQDDEDTDQGRLREELRKERALLRQILSTVVALTGADPSSGADPASVGVSGRPKPPVKSAVDEFTKRRRARETS